MKRGLPAQLCYVVLLCAIVGAMLCVLWIPQSSQKWLHDNVPRIFSLIRQSATIFPSWPQYFAVQTAAAVVAVLLPLCLFAFSGRASRHRPEAFFFAALLVAFALWSALSYVWSAWPYGTRGQVVRQLPFLVLCAGAVVTCRSERRWLTLAAVFAVAGTVQAVLQSNIVVGQALSRARPMSLRLLRNSFYINPLFFGNKNFGCATLITTGLCALGLCLRYTLCTRQGPVSRAVLAWIGTALALGVVGFLLIASSSLAAFIAAGVAVSAYAFCVLLPRKLKWALAAVLAAGLIGSGVVLQSPRLRTAVHDWAVSPDSTAHLRVVYWSAAGEMYAERPVLGWGEGTFSAVYPSFKPPMASGLRFTADIRSTHPHNELVRIAVELGGVGLLLHLALLALAFGVSHRALARAPLRTRLLGYALWAGCLAYVVQGLFSKAPMQPQFAALFWCLLGVLASAALWPAHTAEAEEPPSPSGDTVQWVTVAAVAVLAAWGWWQWGVNGYRSMVWLREAEQARQNLEPDGSRPEAFEAFTGWLDRARPRCLWPTHVLYYDYVIGWHLVNLGRWVHARDYLLENVVRWSPDMRRVQLLIARCESNLGNTARALELTYAYMRKNPHDLEGYRELGRLQPAPAADLLERHLRETDGLGDPEKVGELVALYAVCGAQRKARNLVTFFARSQQVTPAWLLRPLAQRLRRWGYERKLEALRRTFPEFLPAEEGEGG